MDLPQVVSFAISREIEAAEFYRDLQTRIESDAGKLLLKELEHMERQHIKLLTDFNVRTVANFKPIDISDLKLSNAMVFPSESTDMTFQDLIVLAMKREEISQKLYTILADEARDLFIINLFRKLAEEESKHKFDLETLYEDEFLKEN